MSLAQWAVCALGLVCGVGFGLTGVKKRAPQVAAGAFGLNESLKLINAASAGTLTKAAAAFTSLNANDTVSIGALAMVGGFLGSQGVAATGIAIAAARSPRDAGHGGGLDRALERASYFLTEGLSEYRAKYRKADLAKETRDRSLEFEELLMTDLTSHVRNGPLSRREVYKNLKQMGATLLRLVFESNGQHDQFRLAIFEIRDEHLHLTVSAGPGDSPHSSSTLKYPDSFLGDVIKTGRPDVWVAGESTTHPYQVRDKSRFKCFYAQPILCEEGRPRWGGFTIDYVKKRPKVFTEGRRRAIRAFARYVEILYALSEKEAGHEERPGV